MLSSIYETKVAIFFLYCYYFVMLAVGELKVSSGCLRDLVYMPAIYWLTLTYLVLDKSQDLPRTNFVTGFLAETSLHQKALQA